VPEMNEGDRGKIGTFFFALGFLLMMAMEL